MLTAENEKPENATNEKGNGDHSMSASGTASANPSGTASANQIDGAHKENTKVFVKDLAEKQSLHSLFLVREKALLSGKNGKAYLSLSLADRTGAVDARVWDNVELVSESFQAGDVVRIKGQVQIFQNRRQVIVHRLDKARVEEYDLADFLSASLRAPEEMFAELVKIAEAIEDRSIRQLVLETLSDSEVRPRLLVAPAAKSIHHAYRSGLLEHIVSICHLMRALHGLYTAQGVKIKLDYLIFGAIFHDIGKIWELKFDDAVSYTDKGRLLGHMILAVELVEKKASRILGFPEATKDHLKHIILSHHGRLEYGSPKLPMSLEAFIVAAVDDLDSKINTISGFIQAERQASPGESWSRFNQLFERHFLLK